MSCCADSKLACSGFTGTNLTHLDWPEERNMLSESTVPLSHAHSDDIDRKMIRHVLEVMSEIFSAENLVQ